MNITKVLYLSIHDLPYRDIGMTVDAWAKLEADTKRMIARARRSWSDENVVVLRIAQRLLGELEDFINPANPERLIRYRDRGWTQF